MALDTAVDLLLLPTLKLLGAAIVVIAACRLILRMPWSRTLAMNSLVLVVVGWLTIVAVGDARRAFGELTDQRDALEDVTNRVSRESCAPFHGANLAFLRHVAKRIDPSESYHLAISLPAIDATINLCMNFYLLPRRPARSPQRTDWIVFYEFATPELVRLVEGGAAGVDMFDSRRLLGLGRTNHAQ